jgi:hypothetical protein
MKQIASKQGVLIPDELDTSLDPLLPFAGRFVSPCASVLLPSCRAEPPLRAMCTAHTGARY